MLRLTLFSALLLIIQPAYAAGPSDLYPGEDIPVLIAQAGTSRPPSAAAPASDRLRDIELFIAAGGWEADNTVRGWQADLFYGGIESIHLYAGASYADKFFFNRLSAYGKVYAFYSLTGYVKLALGEKIYDYPESTNPVPDSNAYRRVPTVEVEVADDLTPSLRAGLAYEYFRPDFFYALDTVADNHKISGELSYRTSWKPLRLRALAAYLRDPDPDKTTTDRSARTVDVVYGNQFLLGGGGEITFPRLTAQLLYLPNRDMDRSTDFSWLAKARVPLNAVVAVTGEYIYDHYSKDSPFDGQSAQIAMLSGTWTARPWLDLSAGTKFLHRPILNDKVVFATARFMFGKR